MKSLVGSTASTEVGQIISSSVLFTIGVVSSSAAVVVGGSEISLNSIWCEQCF